MENQQNTPLPAVAICHKILRAMTGIILGTFAVIIAMTTVSTGPFVQVNGQLFYSTGSFVQTSGKLLYYLIVLAALLSLGAWLYRIRLEKQAGKAGD